ncbi:MAG: helix-turn-helix transcriptional regulator [Bacillus sp. (in: firmicutes)]
MVNNIRDIRIKRGLTQKEFASMLNISYDYLNKLERGKKTPSLTLAVRMARSLDCKLDDIFFID